MITTDRYGEIVLKTVSFIDLGTNSCRLNIVELTADSRNYNEIIKLKEVVRLGEGEFESKQLTQAAMDRTIKVLKMFAEISVKYNSDDTYAVATAAVREANNKDEFIERVNKETGINMKVISGNEEARLIYLGVSSNVNLESRTGLFVDIGGGTTELIVGDAKNHKYLESCKLGAIRVYDEFFAENDKPVSKKKYNYVLEHVMATSNHAARHIKSQGFDLLYGSSGTITTLGEITARRIGNYYNTFRNYEISYSDLKETINILSALSVEDRKLVPGINPERADIIIAGAAVLEGIMLNTGATSVNITDSALKEGLLIDYICSDLDKKQKYQQISNRERSILSICNSCKYEKKHADLIAKLSLNIFDQLETLGLHNYTEKERELLKYSALLHDVGVFISINDHHKHSYYLIRNWRLAGFDDEQIEIIASSALCHRKLTPQKAGLKLSENAKRIVEVFSSIIRMAESLDRSQLGLIEDVKIKWLVPGKDLKMIAYSNENPHIEIWSAIQRKSYFENTFNVSLKVEKEMVPTK